jgi:uncharacterized protein (DUF58 family)
MRTTTITPAGLGLAGATVGLYAAGVLLGYPVLIALAVGGVAILLTAALAVALRPRVTLTRRVSPDRVSVGEPALGRIDVHNTSRWPTPPFTAIDRVGDASVELPVGLVAGGGRRALHYPVPTPRRGRIQLGPLTVERRDPLGLVRRAQRQTGDDVLWVHPRVHQMRTLPVGLVLDYEGRTTENARLGTVTFSSLRDYVPGDDPRQIHWRSTARTGTLIVREHVDTTEPTTTVVLDTRAGALDAEAFEHAVEVAASIGYAVEGGGRPVALHILGETGGDGINPMLDRLAAAAQSPQRDPLRLLDLVERIEGGGTLVVVTGAGEPGLLTRLAEQRRRFNPVVVVTVLGAADQGTSGTRRRPGMAVLAVRSGIEAATAWNRMIGGDTG